MSSLAFYADVFNTLVSKVEILLNGLSVKFCFANFSIIEYYCKRLTVINYCPDSL